MPMSFFGSSSRSGAPRKKRELIERGFALGAYAFDWLYRDLGR